MLLRALVISLFALLISINPARAEELKFFSSVIVSPSSQFYFYLDSEADPTSVALDGTSFTFQDATLYVYNTADGFMPTTDSITFYDLSQGGGFSLARGFFGSGIRYYGSQLFNGATSDPFFAPLMTTLDNDYFPASSEFTITASDAVPEIGTWFMMLVGFGMIAFSVRHRRGAEALARIQAAAKA